MNRKLTWKAISIALVLLMFGAVGVWPMVAPGIGLAAPAWLMDRQLKLGRDLKGGVHLVLRVETDHALRMEVEQAIERLRDGLTMNGLGEVKLAASGATDFRAEGIRPEQSAAFRLAAGELQTA